SDKIEIRTSPSSINLTEGMSITLGGIAKGYIVDAGLQVLDDMGFEYVLINAGGDIASIGGRPKMPWTIALENPANRENYIARFKIQGKAVATSGNYLRYYNESENIGHIMDPKTGYSVDTCWSSTIIANNCTYADSLATSVFVLGPLKGMQLIESLNDIEGLIIDAESKIHRSSGLDEFELME
ncbi:MAG: FAD:protein FMN transferase, partial [Candidatus Heimdallarchaeota archaeon]|nr:FAD:protein FMN transferase [Candidatus Heimdallarchaeota archaeon]